MDPDPYLRLMDPEGPKRAKTCGSCGSESPKLGEVTVDHLPRASLTKGIRELKKKMQTLLDKEHRCLTDHTMVSRELPYCTTNRKVIKI
jgi:hypothetical protein